MGRTRARLPAAGSRTRHAGARVHDSLPGSLFANVKWAGRVALAQHHRVRAAAGHAPALLQVRLQYPRASRPACQQAPLKRAACPAGVDRVCEAHIQAAGCAAACSAPPGRSERWQQLRVCCPLHKSVPRIALKKSAGAGRRRGCGAAAPPVAPAVGSRALARRPLPRLLPSRGLGLHFYVIATVIALVQHRLLVIIPGQNLCNGAPRCGQELRNGCVIHVHFHWRVRRRRRLRHRAGCAGRRTARALAHTLISGSRTALRARSYGNTKLLAASNARLGCELVTVALTDKRSAA